MYARTSGWRTPKGNSGEHRGSGSLRKPGVTDKVRRAGRCYCRTPHRRRWGGLAGMRGQQEYPEQENALQQLTADVHIDALYFLRIPHVNVLCVLSHFSCVQLFSTLWTVARQVPLSMGFSRQECWSAMPSSEGASQLRERTYISYNSCIGRQVLYH